MTDQEKTAAAGIIADLKHAQGILQSLPPSSTMIGKVGPILKDVVAFLQGEGGGRELC